MGGVTKNMISTGQTKKIHALKNALKLEDVIYRKMLFINHYTAKSSKELTHEEATGFINFLEMMATKKGVWTKYEGKDSHEKLGYRGDMATPAQLRMIEAMWKDVSVINDTKGRQKALRTWLHNKFKVSDLRFLDNSKAGKVIYALKQMKKRKQQERLKDSQQGKCIATI